VADRARSAWGMTKGEETVCDLPKKRMVNTSVKSRQQTETARL
jgi:hypothetical protein